MHKICYLILCTDRTSINVPNGFMPSASRPAYTVPVFRTASLISPVSLSPSPLLSSPPLPSPLNLPSPHPLPSPLHLPSPHPLSLPLFTSPPLPSPSPPQRVVKICKLNSHLMVHRGEQVLPCLQLMVNEVPLVLSQPRLSALSLDGPLC